MPGHARSKSRTRERKLMNAMMRTPKRNVSIRMPTGGDPVQQCSDRSQAATGLQAVEIITSGTMCRDSGEQLWPECVQSACRNCAIAGFSDCQIAELMADCRIAGELLV